MMSGHKMIDLFKLAKIKKKKKMLKENACEMDLFMYPSFSYVIYCKIFFHYYKHKFNN